MKRLAGERRALAAAVMIFYAFFYALVALAAPEGWSRAFGAMGLVYGLAFFGLVAGYFWARWYAVGVGLSGVISAAVSLWQLGPEPVLLFVGGTHLAACLMLWGDGMASLFDGRDSWRARFHLDEAAVNRLGNAVTRAAVSLPFVLLYALAPKDGAGVAALGAAGLVTLGLAGLARMRTWGVLALGGGAVALAGSIIGAASSGCLCALGASAPTLAPQGAGAVALPIVAAGLLIAAVVPFAPPVARFLARRARG